MYKRVKLVNLLTNSISSKLYNTKIYNKNIKYEKLVFYDKLYL